MSRFTSLVRCVILLCPAIGCGDNTVKVLQETLTLKGHTSEVYSVAFSPDAKRLASAGLSNTVNVWDAGTGQETLTFNVERIPYVFSSRPYAQGMALSPDGKWLAGGSVDKTVKVWEAATGQRTTTLV